MPAQPKKPLTVDARRLLEMEREVQKRLFLQLRKNEDLTQEELAEHLGVSAGTVRKLESGATLFLTENCVRFMAAYGMGPTSFRSESLKVAKDIESKQFRAGSTSDDLLDESSVPYDPHFDPPDPARWADYWAQAESDARLTRTAADKRQHDWASTAAQAAAASAAKAVVVACAGDPSPTSIQKLLGACFGPSRLPHSVRDAAGFLDYHAAAARNPAAHDSGPPSSHYSEADSRAAAKHMRTIFEFCRNHLPGKPPMPG